MRRRFARAAADRERYEHASWLQREIAKRTAERLDYIRLSPQVIVDAGAGNGYASRMLSARFPAARIIAVDQVTQQLRAAVPSRGAANWLQRLMAASRSPSSSSPSLPVSLTHDPRRVHSVVADFARLPLPDASVDCVWSNLALQWAPDPIAVFAEWHRVLSSGGLVLFTSLGPDTLNELRAAWARADRVALLQAATARGAGCPAHVPVPDRVHRFIDMHDIGDMLVHAGFADPVMDMETVTLTYREVDALVADLRGAGAAGSHEGRPRGLTGKARWRAMRDAYETLRRDDGHLPATFEIVYGHAWKPAPRKPTSADGLARVRIEDIGGRRRGS